MARIKHVKTSDSNAANKKLTYTDSMCATLVVSLAMLWESLGLFLRCGNQYCNYFCMFRGVCPSDNSLLPRYIGQILRSPRIVVIMVPAQDSDNGDETARIPFIIGEVDQYFSYFEMYVVFFALCFASEP